MSKRLRCVIVIVALALGALSISCSIEGGAPGREICVNCK